MADVHFKTVNFASATGTGNADYIDAALGGATPKAAIIRGAANTTYDSHVVGYFQYEGYFDGTHQRVVGIRAQNNQALSDSARERRDDRVINIPANGNSFFDAAAVSFIPGGIRIDRVSSGFSLARLFSITFFWGDDVGAYVGALDAGNTAGGTVSTTAPGFTPDIVFANHVSNIALNGNESEHAIWTTGCAINKAGNPQRCSGFLSLDGNLNEKGPCQHSRNDCFLSETFFPSGSVGRRIQLDSFDANGFTVRTPEATSNTTFHYLALKLPGADLSLVDIATPTTTGAQAITGVGFQPQGLIGVATGCPAVNTAYSRADQTGGLSMFMTDASVQSSYGHYEQTRNSSNSVNGYMSRNAYTIDTPLSAGMGQVLAALTSFDADGFTLNYTAVNGTSRYGWALALRAPDPEIPASEGTPSGLIFVAM